ncbi:response regulator [Actinoplanes sp. NPDC049265]|uniref:response regulator n=1 Tax=Actinoplanes sp. NPDC049265 TaxID=3363902 RepID=UPI0037161BEE
MCAYVLNAEDDEGQAEVLRQYLEADGHRAAVVHDGQSALDHALRAAPDLLVLDVMLPVLNGLQVCRRLRQESVALNDMRSKVSMACQRVVGVVERSGGRGPG